MNRIIRMTALFVLLAVIAVLAPAASAQLGRQQGLVDANVAAEKDLAALPHMTGDLVKAVVAKRPFASVTELDAVLAPSLTAEQRAALYGRLWIHINLNSATREEMSLIPRMGRRMMHEFEEYRPYKSLKQFRKEMGKYVDATEVARLEQYVFVPINLNAASDEEILTLPGLGRRMLHEFKEYRPYRNIEQFRKEIGKYVDAKEVARLERYVTL